MEIELTDELRKEIDELRDGSAPEEWWKCPASEYNVSNTDDEAECGKLMLCGTSACAYKKTGKPPANWTGGKPIIPCVGFDLEIATQIPDGTEDLLSLLPLGISCAAIHTPHGVHEVWRARLNNDGVYEDRMTAAECDRMLDHLLEYQVGGYPVVTWNGLGFDFAVLAHECSPGRRPDVINLAKAHMDPAFHMLGVKGYMVSLDTAAQALGVGQKTEGITGSMAPAMWQEGRESQELVLQYVAQDAKITAAVYQAIQEKGGLRWISRAGNPQFWSVGKNGLLPVNKVLDLPLPDVGWMTKPRLRGDFLKWMD